MQCKAWEVQKVAFCVMKGLVYKYVVMKYTCTYQGRGSSFSHCERSLSDIKRIVHINIGRRLGWSSCRSGRICRARLRRSGLRSLLFQLLKAARDKFGMLVEVDHRVIHVHDLAGGVNEEGYSTYNS